MLTSSPKHILVAQTIYLGDLVLSTPLLDALRQNFPEARITVLVNSGLEPVLANNPAVDEVIGFEKAGAHSGFVGLLKLADRLRQGHIDTAFVLPGSIRTALAVRLARIPRRIGTSLSTGMALFEKEVRYPAESRKSMQGLFALTLDTLWRGLGRDRSFISETYTDVVHLDPSRSAMARHLQLLEPLGVTAGDQTLRPRLFPGERERDNVAALLAPLAGKKLVALAPGSRWKTKRWPKEHFAALAQMVLEEGCGVVLVGGTEDRVEADFVESTIDHAAALNVCGLLTELESCELLRRCSVLVSNDSAPVHLAAAMEIPEIVILGPTVSKFGFVVPSPKLRILELNYLSCRPCTPHGGERCPIGTHECLTNIAPRLALEAIHEFVTIE